MLKLIILSLAVIIIVMCLTNINYSKASNTSFNSENMELKSNYYNNFDKFELPLKNNILYTDILSGMSFNSINNHANNNDIICNPSYTECEYGKIHVLIDDIPDLETRKAYLTEISTKANYLVPRIYNITHKDKNIDNVSLLSEIKIIKDPASNLAYAKLRFEDLLDSKYDAETGVYLGNIDFTYNDISGVLAHELAHYLKVPKKSNIFNDLTWMEEGVSDYVYNELGYSSKSDNHYPHCESGQTYRHGYMCAADLFIYIEKKYQKNIPVQYVYMLENGIGVESYDALVADLFKDYVGKDVDTLWSEYLEENNI